MGLEAFSTHFSGSHFCRDDEAYISMGDDDRHSLKMAECDFLRSSQLLDELQCDAATSLPTIKLAGQRHSRRFKA